ncbi:MAG: SGNH/GDSL hydrolase family protein [Clostridia bacterium]|nr:SGNH/GDSL hydrolase family protein [Clostridia bacterium]
MNTYTVNNRTYEILEESKPYFLGRWFEKEVEGIPHMATTTDGAQIYFLIEGAESFTVNFTVITRITTPMFAVSVDGAEPVRRPITEPTVTLPDTDRHAVCLTMDGMSEAEGKWYEEIGFAVKGVTLSEGGRLWGIRPTAPLVFFYGDSITEGINALGTNGDSLSNSATHAYPHYCAEALGITPYYVGYGASGMVRVGWFNTMEKAIDRMSLRCRVADSPAANQEPDLIVINHGTNDGGLLTQEFTVAARDTLTRLSEVYPSVPVVYVIPLFQSQAEAIRTLMAEYPNGYVVETLGWPVAYSDGIHPCAEGAGVFGERLAEEIRSLGLI